MSYVDDDDHQQFEPPPPPKKKTNGWQVLLVLTILVGALIICSVIGAHSGTPAQTSTPTPATSIVDQVTQAFNTYTSPPTVTSYSPDSFLVEAHVTGDQAGEAETIATATSLASGYQKTVWQANIDGLSSVTVIIVQTDYPDIDSTTTDQDLVKCIVTSATGMSLDWNSGTPMQHFQQFDVKWIMGQGVEPN